VLPTIDLNGQASFATNEIADVTEYRHLPYKLVPVYLPVAHAIPKNRFRIRLIDA